MIVAGECLWWSVVVGSHTRPICVVVLVEAGRCRGSFLGFAWLHRSPGLFPWLPYLSTAFLLLGRKKSNFACGSLISVNAGI